MLATPLRIMTCTFAFLCAFRGIYLACSRISLLAQSRPKLALDDILRDRTLCFFLFFLFGMVVSYAINLWLLVPCTCVAFALTKKAPMLLDKRQTRELRNACDREIDVMADIVAMGVQSGLSFDAALALYCDKFDNALSKQLQRAQLEWTSGLASRQEALKSLCTRTQSKALERFSKTSLQAMQHGSPLADMLKRFSADIRRCRRVAVEQQIAKSPVKLLIPTGTCILPAMLIFVMGPVLIQFTQTSF